MLSPATAPGLESMAVSPLCPPPPPPSTTRAAAGRGAASLARSELPAPRPPPVLSSPPPLHVVHLLDLSEHGAARRCRRGHFRSGPVRRPPRVCLPAASPRGRARVACRAPCGRPQRSVGFRRSIEATRGAARARAGRRHGRGAVAAGGGGEQHVVGGRGKGAFEGNAGRSGEGLRKDDADGEGVEVGTAVDGERRRDDGELDGAIEGTGAQGRFRSGRRLVQGKRFRRQIPGALEEAVRPPARDAPAPRTQPSSRRCDLGASAVQSAERREPPAARRSTGPRHVWLCPSPPPLLFDLDLSPSPSPSPLSPPSSLPLPADGTGRAACPARSRVRLCSPSRRSASSLPFGACR